MVEQHSHAVCVLDSSDSGLSPIYIKVKEYLLAGYAVVYAAEDNVEDAINNLKYFGIDADYFLSINALQVIDRDLYYNPNKELEPQKLLDQLSKVIAQIDFQRFKGMLGIGSAGPAFFEKDKLEPLLEYEHKIGRVFDVPVEIICCYRSDDIKQLKFRHLVSIITSHAYMITSEAIEHKELNTDLIISLISSGIDQALSAKMSYIVLKTLEVVYNISAEQIVAQPRDFEDVLEKVLGVATSKIVLTRIQREIQNALMSKG